MRELDTGQRLELGTEESKEAYDGKPHVYHVTGRCLLESILTKGLVPLNPNFRNRIDSFMDQFAPQGFSRTNAVFAYPELNLARKSLGLIFSSVPHHIIVQAEVDPKMVFVANIGLYTSIKMAVTMKDWDTAEKLARIYWDEGILLEDYLKLNQADPKRLGTPEAIVPSGIATERLSVL